MRKNTIKGVEPELAEVAVNYVDKEVQPNNLLNLQLYYLFSKNGKKDIGEAPNLVDTPLVDYSRFQIEKFLQSKGYLKARVTDTIVVKKKRAELIFTAKEGPLFKIRRFTDSIPDKRVEALYRQNRVRFSRVQPGGRFDSDSLAFDRDEFYLIMKRNGYYDFLRQYITFNYDSTFNNSVVDIKMIVSNPDGKNAHPVYKINNTLITIAKSNGRTDGKADTLQVDSQFRFVDYSKRFKPHTVTDYVFQKKGELYDIDKQTLTTSRLSELNVFRNVPNPSYKKLPDSTNRLDSKIDIIPLKRMSDRVEGEFLFNGGRYGYNLGNTFTDRNVFKQAAILQVKLNWSVLYNTNRSNINKPGIENQDLNAGATLTYPRLITPFDFPAPGKYGVPHTIFSTNYEYFYQQGLVQRQSFVNTLTYDFAETASKLHTITPIDIEFSKGVINKSADSALLKNNRYSYIYLIGRTVFSLGSQYTYQLNANKLKTYGNFVYFRGSLNVGGNVLHLVTDLLNTKKDSSGERTIFGYPFAQFTKVQVDFRSYTSLGGERQFIFRLLPGIGIPYGNSKLLVFENNFYAGGSDDMRGWLPRTLGPGRFNRATYYGNGANANNLREDFRYIDQLGEVKIIANAEYRYTLSNDFFGSKLKGALFLDAGNVWRLHDNASNPNGTFNLGTLAQSTAMDIGTGLRFDLGFFVFRLDAALKFKDPQFSGSQQWVLINHPGELFGDGPFKQAYHAANYPDTYNFLQLNFGIGMPF